MKSLFKLRKIFSSDTLNSISLYNPVKIYRSGTQAKAFLALSVVSIIWGTTWVISKQGVMNMPALQLAGIRQFIAGTLYLLYFILKGEKFPEWKEAMPLVILALLNFVLSNGLSTWGIRYISAGLGSIMGAVFPLWLVIIGLFFNAEKTPSKAIIGLIIGFAGVCIIFYDYLTDFLNPEFRFGILLSMIATWTWALGTLYTKHHAKKFNPYFGLGFQMLIAGSMLLGVSFATDNFMPLSEIPSVSWFAIGYLIIFGSIIGFVSYLYALQNLPTEQASVYAYINPVIAVLAGVLILNEKFNIWILTGGIATLYGVYMVNKAYKTGKSEK